MNQLLKTFPIVTKIQVIWGDLDSFQHVNNVTYFRYFESARIQYFETLGWLKLYEKMAIGPILGFTYCSYRIPLTYPDTVFVGSKITELHEKRFTMEHLLVREKHEKPVAEGNSIVVCYNYQKNQTTPIPKAIRQSIEKLEERVFEIN